jgi:hypothetical protein
LTAQTAGHDSVHKYYELCLKGHIDSLVRYNKQLGLPVSDTFYVEYAYYLEGEIPDSIGDFRIIVLTNKEMFKIGKKSIGVHVIRPMEISGNLVTIKIIGYAVSVKNRKMLHSVNYGGSKCKFRYNCTSDRFEFVGQEFW